MSMLLGCSNSLCILLLMLFANVPLHILHEYFVPPSVSKCTISCQCSHPYLSLNDIFGPNIVLSGWGHSVLPFLYSRVSISNTYNTLINYGTSKTALPKHVNVMYIHTRRSGKRIRRNLHHW